MVIVSKAILRDYAERNPDVTKAIFNWYNLVREANWKNFSEMKKTFNSVDAVGNDRYVFNLKGNQCRLVVLIIFRVRTVFMLFIGLHKEYDKISADTVKHINFGK